MTDGNLPSVELRSLEPGSLIPFSSLPAEQQKEAEEIAASVDFNKTTVALTYGADIQRKMNSFLDTALADIKTEEADVAGLLAIELAKGIDMMQIAKFKEAINPPSGLFAKLGRALSFGDALIKQIRVFAAKKQDIMNHLAQIEIKGKDRQENLLRFLAKMDQLGTESVGYVEDAKPWIVGGQMALQRGHEELEQLKITYNGAEYKDPLEAAKIHDFAGQLTKYDVRLTKMKIAFVESATIVQAQIRTIQESSNIEIQNIQDRLLFDMVKLKRTVLNVAALANIKKSQSEGQEVTDALDKLDELSSDMMTETYTEAKKSQGNAAEAVQKLMRVADAYVNMIDQGKEIAAETARNRREAEAGLAEIKEKVSAALSNV